MSAPATATQTRSLVRFAWLSIAAALSTIVIKTGAWLLTDSVGLLSDALESIVNLVAAVVALFAIRIAEAPADEEHAHGHEKIEYFSSGFEGAMIFAAATAIIITAVERLREPKPISELGLGLAVSTGASIINLVVGRVLIAAGKKHNSIVLEADGHHLMTDVWTSVGVVVGLVLVLATGASWLDPVLAIAVAINIVVTGTRLLLRSARGLLDVSVPKAERARIDAALEAFRSRGVEFHAVRTRQAGARTFVSLHVLVPGDWTVQRGHDLVEEVEAAIRALGPKTTVLTHVEPLEDPCSYEDVGLDRD
ncbi:MAG: cation transporter [Myxococcales bacterium]|nr:cation transporter [Myxococcales bacterium]